MTPILLNEKYSPKVPNTKYCKRASTPDLQIGKIVSACPSPSPIQSILKDKGAKLGVFISCSLCPAAEAICMRCGRTGRDSNRTWNQDLEVYPYTPFHVRKCSCHAHKVSNSSSSCSAPRALPEVFQTVLERKKTIRPASGLIVM